MFRCISYLLLNMIRREIFYDKSTKDFSLRWFVFMLIMWMFVGQDTKFSPQGIHGLQLCHLQFPKQFVPLHKDNLCTLSLSTGYLMLTFSRSFLVCVCIFFFPVLNPSETFSGYSLDRTLNKSFSTPSLLQGQCNSRRPIWLHFGVQRVSSKISVHTFQSELVS